MMESLKRQGTGVMAKNRMHPWYAEEMAHHRLPESYDCSGPILFVGGCYHNVFLELKEWPPCFKVLEPVAKEKVNRWKPEERYYERKVLTYYYNLTVVATKSSVYFVYICTDYKFDPNAFGSF